MPMFGSPLNPVDISGTASPTQYKGAFMQAMRDPAVDGILGSICPTAVTNVDAVVDVVIEVHDRYRRLGKPFIMECQGGEECQRAIMKRAITVSRRIRQRNRRINAMVALYRYGQMQKK